MPGIPPGSTGPISPVPAIPGPGMRPITPCIYISSTAPGPFPVYPYIPRTRGDRAVIDRFHGLARHIVRASTAGYRKDQAKRNQTGLKVLFHGSRFYIRPNCYASLLKFGLLSPQECRQKKGGPKVRPEIIQYINRLKPSSANPYIPTGPVLPVTAVPGMTRVRCGPVTPPVLVMPVASIPFPVDPNIARIGHGGAFINRFHRPFPYNHRTCAGGHEQG